MPVPPIDSDQIVVTASRAPEAQSASAASVTIIDQQATTRLGDPLASDVLRLVPSAAVSVSGPPGSLTEVRIRGAEANHTLLFIDGIRANDPATGDQPRFDLLNADLASRIEVVRGPQSALWGSDAIGGVVAVEGATGSQSSYSVTVEDGSYGFRRAAGYVSAVQGPATLAAAVGWQRATGIDSFDGRGDKDGYRNVSGRVRATYDAGRDVLIGATGFATSARSDFDGFDPVTFLHADTLDNSRSRLGAGRLWAEAGGKSSPWSGHVAGSLLASSNRNFLGDEFLNRTAGTRRTLDGQIERRMTAGGLAHTLIAAAETERESFHARDALYGGATDQNRTRKHHSLTLEWRGEASRFTGDLAIRRDAFNRFRDATSLRGSLRAELGGGFALAGSYAEGIAQPTFFDLYGFLPGSFTGNPSLRPESSRGFEGSLRYRRGDLQTSLTAYRQRLHDEIVDTATSTVNRSGSSRRSGVEWELHWRPSEAIRIGITYAYLHATQPGAAAAPQVREIRRPKHSGSFALDGASGKLSYGATIAYTGRRIDTDFDVYPARDVTLGAYWLAGARVAYRVRPGVELFVRAANAFDAHYQDAFGYRTQGRSLYAGLRLAGG